MINIREITMLHELNKEESKPYFENGFRIYDDLKQKFGCDTPEALDAILNSLCVSFIVLILKHINHDDYEKFFNVIYKIIRENVNKNK